MPGDRAPRLQPRPEGDLGMNQPEGWEEP
jgi:hypothetical protein